MHGRLIESGQRGGYKQALLIAERFEDPADSGSKCSMKSSDWHNDRHVRQSSAEVAVSFPTLVED
jgi:hypothetical protein